MYYGNQYPPQTSFPNIQNGGSVSNQMYQNSGFPPQQQLVYQPQYAQQATLQKSPFNGRMIHTIEEVTPNEVPMDGSFSIFVKDDYSCIYAKAWNTDGTIRTLKFIPDAMSEIENKDTNSIILEKLNTIEELVSRQKVGDANA